MAHLILLRHGESAWNAEGRLSGWADPDLSERGVRESETAAARIREGGIVPHCGFASVLKRAVRTLAIVTAALDCPHLPVCCSWRLNERHYGLLEGRTRQDLYREFGRSAVERWRNAFDARPPPLPQTDPRHPLHDPRYAHLDPDRIPSAESLEDALYRLLPCWRDGIAPALRGGRNVIVVSHRTTLRALILRLERIPPDAIARIDLPTALPLVYTVSPALAVVDRRILDGRQAAIPAAGERGKGEKSINLHPLYR
ncbi:MAG: 2,3-bisphosphoglycerate-dependent phosphoglycerate mutase [Methanomicrobiales archaeon]|nr:2,3-bisphosphoglycerate-dependent phosphoglycerate mutase [Methanomicrobiales archaeon]MDI6876769.1 2,3-bisphosphoglycerate-dependent phosphoglycerate mutase [Methanomicrobiales archaeon]